jgi:hypothetical protein
MEQKASSCRSVTVFPIGAAAERIPDSRLSGDRLTPVASSNTTPIKMSRLTKEEHKAVGIELHGIQHRIEGIANLLRQRYGPVNSATLRADEAQAAVRNLIRGLLTQALVSDFPEDPDPLMFY